MSTTLVAHGVLRPDGWIQLIDPTDLPLEECEVEVSLIVSKPTGATTTSEPPQRPTREPLSFWPDESISAPFSLPREGVARRVEVRQGTGPYLPRNPIFPLAPDPIFVESGDSK